MKNILESKTYLVIENPFAYLTAVNFEPGKGMIQIHSDWGTYSAFWGGMGNKTVEQFILSCDSYYIENNLKYQMGFMGCKKEAYVRLTKFMAHCWPKLTLEISKHMEVSDAT